MKVNLDLKHVLGRTWVIEGSGLMGLYRLDGGKCVLLDSGEVFEREALGALLDAHGLTPIGVICSHVHVDHSINNGWLRERYGTLAAVPKGEVQITRTPVAMKAYFYSASPDALAREFEGMALQSAEKLRNTGCAAYIVAHRGVHTDINAVVDASNAHIRQRAAEIRALVTRPMTFSEIWAAVNEEFSLLSSRPIRAALMERNLRSFVDYLVDQRELKWYAERGMLYYAPVED